jgi:hypothetical protein
MENGDSHGVERRWTPVKRGIVYYVLWTGAVAALLVLAYMFSAYIYCIVNRPPSYQPRVTLTLTHLCDARVAIDLFKEQVGRFPESLDELNEYRKKYPDKTSRWPLREYISRDPKTEGHAKLDGSGGFFYDPQSGDIRVNLTKPLHEYWRRYSGRSKDDIPADW